MSKKATKVNKDYNINVEAAFQQQLVTLNEYYPYCPTGQMSYVRSAYVDGLIRQAEFDFNADAKPSKNGKVYGAVPQLAQAKMDYEDAVFLAERRAEDTDANGVYDTKVERTRQWMDRMELQHYGTKLRLDAAMMLRDYLADKE